jgi:hypothetical protein
MKWRGFTVMGGLTYPLYLMHETVSRPLIKTLFPYYSKWNVLALAILTSLAAAYLVQKVVEEPLQRMLRPRLKRALAQIRAGGAGVPDGPGGDADQRVPAPRGRHVIPGKGTVPEQVRPEQQPPMPGAPVAPAGPDPNAPPGWPDPAVAVHGPPPYAPPPPDGPLRET